MEITLTGKVAIITGAARGIGFSIASFFAESGASVIIADIDAVKGKDAAVVISAKGYICEYKKIDLSKPLSFETFVEEIFQKYKRIDILVNNARAGGKFGLQDENIRNWLLTTNVVLTSSFFLSQNVIKKMSKLNSGVILNISSVAGILATPESPSYHAAKGGLISLTKYLAVEAGAYGIRVNSILPGFIVQDQHIEFFSSQANSSYRQIIETYQPGGKVGTENDVAEAALFLCSDNARYISGESLVLDGAATVQEQSGLSLKIQDQIKNGI